MSRALFMSLHFKSNVHQNCKYILLTWEIFLKNCHSQTGLRGPLCSRISWGRRSFDESRGPYGVRTSRREPLNILLTYIHYQDITSMKMSSQAKTFSFPYIPSKAGVILPMSGVREGRDEVVLSMSGVCEQFLIVSRGP